MSKDCFLDFRNKVHNNKDLFQMPRLSDSDFKLMVEKAKLEARNRNNISLNRSSLFLKKVIISPRLAAALIFAIFAITMASYIRHGSEYTTAENNDIDTQYIDKNTGVPVDNIVRVSSFDSI